MSQKNLSGALNEFVNVLVEQEFEPIRLDIIRIENDLKDFMDSAESNWQGQKKKVEQIRQKQEEVIATFNEKNGKTSSASSPIDDEKFYILKDAIENLAIKASDALAEGFSEQEEQYTEICGELDSKISVLDRKLTQANAEVYERLNGIIAAMEKANAEVYERLNGKITELEKKFAQTKSSESYLL
jgi:chromosome segregation ATPase